MAKFKMSKSPKATAQSCRWFARCDNPAVTTQSHPVLGEVPICKRCADRYKRMAANEPR